MVGVRAFRVGGEGLGSVFTDFFSCFWFGFGLVVCRGPCRSFGRDAVVSGCVSRDICLDVLGLAVGLRCPFLRG